MDIQSNLEKTRRAIKYLRAIEEDLTTELGKTYKPTDKHAPTCSSEDKKSDMRSALYDPREKTLQLDVTREEMDPKYLKYLLESLGLPKDTLVIFKPNKNREGDLNECKNHR